MVTISGKFAALESVRFCAISYGDCGLNNIMLTQLRNNTSVTQCAFCLNSTQLMNCIHVHLCFHPNVIPTQDLVVATFYDCLREMERVGL